MWLNFTEWQKSIEEKIQLKLFWFRYPWSEITKFYIYPSISIPIYLVTILQLPYNCDLLKNWLYIKIYEMLPFTQNCFSDSVIDKSDNFNKLNVLALPLSYYFSRQICYHFCDTWFYNAFNFYIST